MSRLTMVAFSKVKMFYDCLHAETISDVKASLVGISKMVNLIASTQKRFAVFGFSPANYILGMSKHAV